MLHDLAGSVLGPIGSVGRLKQKFKIYSRQVRSPHPIRTTGSAKTTPLATVASCGFYFQAGVAASLKRVCGPSSFRWPGFILVQVAAFDLFEQIQSVIGGERAARTNVELEERLDYYASHFAVRSPR